MDSRLPALFRTRDGWLCGESLVEVLCARSLSEVVPLLAEVERRSAAGCFCAGFVSYEAAAAFDAALTTRPPAPEVPLAAFAVFARRRRLRRLPSELGLHDGAETPLASGAVAWQSTEDSARYLASVERIRAAIAAGEVYQVNYTQRLQARVADRPWQLFRALVEPVPPPHAAYLELDDLAVCSASPELFLAVDGERVVSRPMKGTAPRGRWWEEDEAAGARLQRSEKERAENLMIVDMVRNDLARIARPGSVEVAALFTLERYPTLWQLTSTVAARSAASLPQLFAALFPAASITGAPKVASMRWISELERSPRGIYTGAVGWVGPGRRASFSVAIRTVVVDRRRGIAEYGTGGGITWDSTPASELAESLLKASILSMPEPAFRLLETMRWAPATGYGLREAHLSRLRGSASYFGFRCDDDRIERALRELADGLPPVPHRVRLALGREGEMTVEAERLPGRRRGGERQRRRVALAAQPVDRTDRFLFHKTTHRLVYDAARAARPDCDDVLLWNRAGEITESTVANVVVRLDGELVTPPLRCGLLPGVLRGRLLARGRIVERVIHRDDLGRATGIWLVNALRGWLPADLRD